MKNIILTGAAGYIGSHTAFWLLQSTPHKLILIDDLRSGFKENIAFLQSKFNKRVEFVGANAGDKNTLKEIFSRGKIDALIHLSASLIVPESVVKPLLYYENNVGVSLDILEVALEFKLPHFIFSSTAAVYGESNVDLVDELSPLEPINPYGRAKLMIEEILEDIARIYSLKYVSLRYFNVAGSLDGANTLGQRTKDATHLIKVAAECAHHKRDKLEIYGNDYDTADGTCIRDYVHINDLARAHVSALEFLAEKDASDVFNVGYANGHSVKEVIASMKRVSSSNFNVSIRERRLGDTKKLVASNAKILAKTSWRPLHNNLDEITKSAYLFEQYV